MRRPPSGPEKSSRLDSRSCFLERPGTPGWRPQEFPRYGECWFCLWPLLPGGSSPCPGQLPQSLSRLSLVEACGCSSGRSRIGLRGVDGTCQADRIERVRLEGSSVLYGMRVRESQPGCSGRSAAARLLGYPGGTRSGKQLRGGLLNQAGERLQGSTCPSWRRSWRRSTPGSAGWSPGDASARS